MIAALYTASTLLLAPLSYGPLQLRVAEALTLLPVLTPTAPIGLTVGCIIANAIGVATGSNSCGVADILFGSLATLLAAFVTRWLRNITIGKAKLPILAALAPPIFNGLIVGAELALIFKLPFWVCALQVGCGELLVTMLLGIPLCVVLRRLKFFSDENR